MIGVPSEDDSLKRKVTRIRAGGKFSAAKSGAGVDLVLPARQSTAGLSKSLY
jgi:hypothetical protein